MDIYKLRIELLSDTMMGSGMAVPGIIDSDIRYDEYGLPYMNAKTLKGHIREQMELLQAYDAEYATIDIGALLGSDDKAAEKKLGKLRFSKVCLSEGVQETLKDAIRKGIVTKLEILNAITVIYVRTKINALGVVENHSLRKERELRKGLKFESAIYGENLSNEEKALLKDAVKAIKHIGMHKSKGKGVVSCRILEERGAQS